MSLLRVIADIHGDYGWYIKTVQKANYKGIPTFQLGDFGIGFLGRREEEKDEKWLTDSLNLAPMNRFGPGNHDNPLYCRNSPLCVGYYNYFPNMDMFWAGGAYSIDKDWRTEGVNWWRGEEMSYSDMLEATDLYQRNLPSIMTSHDAPWEVVGNMFPHCLLDGGDGSMTNKFLSNLLSIHRPKIWLFGHHHKTMTWEDQGTKFICVGEREYIDIDVPGWDGKWD